MLLERVDDPKAARRDIERLAEAARPKELVHGMIKLGNDFVLGPRDVICARGKLALNHTGNCRFRVVLEMNLPKYAKAGTKVEKSSIVSSIVDLIREGSPNGGFVKKEKGEWYKIGDHLARQKVGQSLRDLLYSKRCSSNKTKGSHNEELHKIKDNGRDMYVSPDMERSMSRDTMLTITSPENNSSGGDETKRYTL